MLLVEVAREFVLRKSNGLEHFDTFVFVFLLFEKRN